MAVNINLTGVETTTNKQNSLAADGTNTKYPTVTAVNGGLAGKQNVMGADDNYVTDAQLVVISNTSGTNTGDETTTTIGVLINNSTDINTIEDADKIPMYDAGGIGTAFKHALWSLVKSTLKTYFDTLYKPTFSENTAFNKNFGTTSGTVCEGNDTRLLSYVVQPRFYTSLNPADSTTYYPVYTFAGGIIVNDNRSRHKALKSGTIINVNFTYICIAGSSEGVTIQIHNLTAGTSVTVTSTLDMSVASANLQYLGNSLTYSVGDEIQVRIVTPAWATNPTAFLFCFDLNFI